MIQSIADRLPRVYRYASSGMPRRVIRSLYWMTDRSLRRPAVGSGVLLVWQLESADLAAALVDLHPHGRYAFPCRVVKVRPGDV